MNIVTRVLLVLTLVGLFALATSHPSARAEQAQFSLAVGQSVTVGPYTLLFRGMTGTLPAYDLYRGSILVARFPTSAPPLNPAEYSYGNGNISIATTAVAPDGSAVSGTLIAR